MCRPRSCTRAAPYRRPLLLLHQVPSLRQASKQTVSSLNNHTSKPGPQAACVYCSRVTDSSLYALNLAPAGAMILASSYPKTHASTHCVGEPISRARPVVWRSKVRAWGGLFIMEETCWRPLKQTQTLVTSDGNWSRLSAASVQFPVHHPRLMFTKMGCV